MLKPAIELNISIARCAPPPLPDVPELSCPGFALASAMNSLSVFAGSAACTVTRYGVTAASVIGAKSRTGSYARFAYMLTLVDIELIEHISSV